MRVPSVCESSQDCPSQHVCVSGLCQCQCSEQNNCAQGERCKNGVCMKICYSDSNCLPGELCIDGTCEAGCTSDVGCKRDEVCINNKCRYLITLSSLNLSFDAVVVSRKMKNVQSLSESQIIYVESSLQIGTCRESMDPQISSEFEPEECSNYFIESLVLHQYVARLNLNRSV